jgi:hypothetical protein
LNSIFDDDNYNTDKGSEQNEMERYLRDTPTAPTEKTLLENWQSIRQQYPTVARMAKDVLSIAMAGVGVERIFNSGRDTCQYRRGHLHAETIKKIMLVKHADNEQLVDETLLSEVELLMEMKTDIYPLSSIYYSYSTRIAPEPQPIYYPLTTYSIVVYT